MMNARAALGRASRATPSPSARSSRRSSGPAPACRASRRSRPPPSAGADHPPPRRQADAADHEVAGRGDARARPVCGLEPRPRQRPSRRGARAAAQARGDLLIPIVKGWSTETGIEVASTGIQVHGGMGFIEETGAAQPLRDVRITSDLRRHHVAASSAAPSRGRCGECRLSARQAGDGAFLCRADPAPGAHAPRGRRGRQRYRDGARRGAFRAVSSTAADDPAPVFNEVNDDAKL
jgi:hypothetical protein